MLAGAVQKLKIVSTTNRGFLVASPIRVRGFCKCLKHACAGRFSQSSQSIPWVGRRGKTSLFSAKHASDDEHFALLIDGDRHGPKQWPELARALQSRGAVLHTDVFAAPQLASNKEWKQVMIDHQIKFVPVPRQAGGAKDPNDIAIAMAATRYATCNSITCIALAVHDLDFVYLANSLKEWGCRSILLVPEYPPLLRLRKAFEEAGSGIVSYCKKEGQSQIAKPKFKLILNQHGHGKLAEIDEADAAVNMTGDMVEREHLSRKMQDSGYVDCESDPLVPAIAKWYYANSFGCLPVWPSALAYHAAASRLQASSDGRCVRNPRDLIFVLPRNSILKGTKSLITKYGSRMCAAYVAGGLPFILKDSEDLVEHFLSKLGFYDKSVSDDVEEAIDIFCDMGYNRSTLTSLGYDVSSRPNAASKLAFLRSILLSTRNFGNWQIASSDGSLRLYLKRRKMITCSTAPRKEVMEALRHYARNENLPIRKTYVGLADAVLKHLNQGSPHLRN